MDSMAWLAQSGMFLMLGLLITPSELGQHLLPALLVALFLMLVARPAAVWVSLIPFIFTWREKLFIAWTGLRGAHCPGGVPAVGRCGRDPPAV